METPYVALHNHSHFSLLNAVPKIPELIKRAQSYGMNALALTDDGNLYGAIEFYRKCNEAGIKPIIGVDFYVALRTRRDKESGIDNKRYRLVLIAETTQGYFNLISLVTESNLSGFYYKPRIDRELMEKYREGIIAIIPAFSSDVVAALKHEDEKGAIERIKAYKDIYGENNVFLEISTHPEILGHDEMMQKVVELSKQTSTPLVAAQETYYLEPGDRQLREVARSIAGGSGVRSFDIEDENFSFLSPKEMEARFSSIPEALKTSQAIADRTNIEIELGTWCFPKLEISSDTTYEDELRKTVYSGIAYRGIEETPEVRERIEYELKIINSKGYAPYFLIVQDLLRFARENEIPTNIRGSVAGSIVTYLAGITNLNPLTYNLRFERFLNPDRPSAPDIDMDYADNRRDEVLEYARKKYGEDKVAQIGTFGTMMARGAVRDVARALGYPYALGDQIAKLIPPGKQGFPMSIDRALKEVPELKELHDTRADIAEIIETAKGIEGNARHISVHAAGVVIAPTKLSDFTPVQIDPKGGKIITQYDMYSIEEAGLPKFDFLGLKNLAILADTVKRVKWRENIEIDLDKIPVDDTKTYEMLSRGETHGTFQLNGSGMTHFLKELKPTNIHDIMAMVALYRPGPMDFIPEYIARKHDPSRIDYPHDSLKDDLERSFGLLIYQEDVMYTAIKLAGYSWLDADKFRKAMGKKIPELMQEQEEKFKSGCIKNGIAKETADDLWERIKPFAAYAFNKAHSASYGWIAYQTSYLKANFPYEYMASVLSADAGDVEKIAETVNECRRMGIEVLPPDINESFGSFTVVDEKNKASIRFGLYSIKNVGEGVADAIIEEREKGGEFNSIEAFLERIPPKFVNRKALESLIKAGALDRFGDRGAQLACIEDMLKYSREQASAPQSQGLFGAIDAASNDIVTCLIQKHTQPTREKDRLGWERELLGIYLSGHPLDRFREKMKNRKFTIEYALKNVKENMPTSIIGIVDSCKEIVTKKGNKMAFATIDDLTGSLEVVIFPEMFERLGSALRQDAVLLIEGKMSYRKGEPSMIIERAKEL